MLDEDDILNETPESSLVNLPDGTTGAPKLEGSTEIATTQTSTTNSVVRNLRCPPFITCPLNYFKEREDN